MIIGRALYRETAWTTAALMVVLVTVVLLYGITGLLGRAARGDLPETLVAALLVWQTVKSLDLLLPLSIYLGLLLTLSRWYRDNEMTVLAACGAGLSQLLRPIISLAIVFAVATAAMSLVVTPYASRAIAALKVRAAERPEFSRIAAGVFTAVASGGVLYAAESTNGGLDRVFLVDLRKDGERVVAARSATPAVDVGTGERRVVLHNGHAYQGNPKQSDWRTVRFERYSVRLEERPAVAPITTISGLATPALLTREDPAAVSEWHGRLARPLLVVVLVMFAAALAYTNARRGRFANLFGAILVYFIYSNLLQIGQAFLRKGEIPGVLGLWWVHALFAAMAAYALWRRSLNRSVFSVPGR